MNNQNHLTKAIVFLCFGFLSFGVNAVPLIEEDPAIAVSTAPGSWANQSKEQLLQQYAKGRLSSTNARPKVLFPKGAGSLSKWLQPFESPTNYDYPYKNYLIATISSAIVRERNENERPGGVVSRLPIKFTFYPERSNIPHYGAHNFANVVFSFKSADAPLIVILGGLGADSDGNMPNYLSDLFNEWGFNVLSLPNVFEWSFGLAASSSGVPGITSEDATDLNRLMQTAYQMVQEQFQLKPSKFILMGYSMGGFHALKMAEQNYQLDLPFEKYILLNAPIDLLHGIGSLDHMSGRSKELSVFEKAEAMSRVVGAGVRLKERDINSPDYYSGLDWWFGLEPHKLEYVIGVIMSSCVADTLLMANEIGENKVLTGRTYYERLLESRKWYINEYMKVMVFPRLAEKAQREGKTFDEVLALETDVRTWKVPAQNLAKVRFLHNEDDFIISPKQLPDVEAIFGKGAMIFPAGGHMGNIWYPTNMALIKQELLH